MAYNKRTKVKCLPEIYEQCSCSTDETGRGLCVCEKFTFWKMYPYIYAVLGVLMISGYIMCYLTKMRAAKKKEAALGSCSEFNDCKEMEI